MKDGLVKEACLIHGQSRKQAPAPLGTKVKDSKVRDRRSSFPRDGPHAVIVLTFASEW